MRTGEEITKEYKPDTEHAVEVLLDIRDLLIEQNKLIKATPKTQIKKVNKGV